MQLTRHTDYALRILLHLAANQNQLTSVTELAQFYDISRNHLVKIVQGLVEHGFVNTVRGRNGGMQLAKPSNAISIGRVVRLMENHFNLVECFDSTHNTCSLDGACRLKGILQRATETFLQTLEHISLADINKPKLRKHIVGLVSATPQKT